jgi:hypothetical protein
MEYDKVVALLEYIKEQIGSEWLDWIMKKKRQ